MADTLFIAFLAIIFLDPRKISQLARQLGRVFAELRRAQGNFIEQLREFDPATSGFRPDQDSATARLVKDATEDA